MLAAHGDPQHAPPATLRVGDQAGPEPADTDFAAAAGLADSPLTDDALTDDALVDAALVDAALVGTALADSAPGDVALAADLSDLRAEALRAGYRTGRFKVVEVIEAVLAAIAARGDDGVWIHVADRADLLRRARELDELAAAARAGAPGPGDGSAGTAAGGADRVALPALFGLPFAVKDNIDVAGMPTTAACPAFGYPSDTTATAVERLLAAGALCVGKTNLDQFATGLSGVRSPYGIPTSPFDPTMIAGGSSSGSGVAVAVGLVTFAVGTDTAGSGRVPAALTNTVGIKPSRGLVSTRGVVPASRSLDCPSVVALSVADASLVLSVMSGYDEADPWSRPFPPIMPITPITQVTPIAVPELSVPRPPSAGPAAAVPVRVPLGPAVPAPTEVTSAEVAEVAEVPPARPVGLGPAARASSRPDPAGPPARGGSGGPAVARRIGVPDPAVLAADCDPAVLAVFETARALAVAAGAELVEVELAPFLAAGALLYQGPWLAERYAAVGEFVAAHPHDVHPVVAELLAPGARISGAAVFGAIDRLRTLRRATAGTWRRIDALMLPTVPRTFSVAEMLADPIRLNARLGRYTTFVNLLDLAAVAVPVGFAAGLPFGVTVIGPAGYDLPLARLGADLHARSGLLAGAGSHPLSVAGL